MKKHYLDIMLDLIRIPSVSRDQGEVKRAVDYVEEFFSPYEDLIVRRYERRGVHSIVIANEDVLDFDILLMGHLDVVPEFSKEQYEPYEENGRIYARGACDMKSGNAIMMAVMRDLAMKEGAPKMALMLTGDEEIGGHNGAEYLIEKLGYRAKVALIPDGSQCMDTVILKNKGILHVKVSAHGKSAHGSKPWLGENAIEKLMESCGVLKEVFPIKEVEQNWYTTCNLGVMHGGSAANTVPHEAHCVLDIRYTEEFDEEALLSLLKKEMPHMEFEILFSSGVSVTQEGDPYVQLYARLIKDKTGEEPRFIAYPGGNDGRFLTKHGIPILVSRPTSEGQHSKEEWVDIGSMTDFYELYCDFVEACSEI